MYNATMYTNTIAMRIVSLNARLVKKMFQTLKVNAKSQWDYVDSWKRDYPFKEHSSTRNRFYNSAAFM